MSLPQMRNLNLEISLSPDAVFLTCAAFRYDHTPAVMATSQHIVMNLAELKENPATLKQGKYRVSDHTSFLAVPDKQDNITEDIPITMLSKCLSCQGIGMVHSYAGDCKKICPACRGQHRPHTRKEGCKLYKGPEQPSEQAAEAPAPTASSSSTPPAIKQNEPKPKEDKPSSVDEVKEPEVTRKRAVDSKEKEEPTVTRKRAALGDPEAKVNTPGTTAKSSGSSSSALPEPQVEEEAPPAPPVPQEDDVKDP